MRGMIQEPEAGYSGGGGGEKEKGTLRARDSEKVRG